MKHLKHFIKSTRGHIHVLKWNINTKYIYMYKLWQRQTEACQVLSKNVNSQKKQKMKILIALAPNVLFIKDR